MAIANIDEVWRQSGPFQLPKSYMVGEQLLSLNLPPYAAPGYRNTNSEAPRHARIFPQLSVNQLQLEMTDRENVTGSWTDAFPAPCATAASISREEALSDLSSPDLLIVDVRRTDYEGGTIRGSINLPAHSFYMNRGVLYQLCKRAGVKSVAFYCGKSVPVS